MNIFKVLEMVPDTCVHCSMDNSPKPEQLFLEPGQGREGGVKKCRQEGIQITGFLTGFKTIDQQALRGGKDLPN